MTCLQTSKLKRYNASKIAYRKPHYKWLVNIFPSVFSIVLHCIFFCGGGGGVGGGFDQGFRFFKVGGLKWPMEQKIVGHFLKWWAQAYQTNHSWQLGSILLHIVTDACMHLCILTADYTVTPVLSGHSKKKTNYRLMQVKSISTCIICRGAFCM